MSKAMALLLAFAGACAGHVAKPILATDLAEGKRGAKLSAYLAQRDASAAVCDLGARGPHLRTFDADVREDLLHGLREGTVEPALWRECVDNVLRSAESETGASLLDAVARSYTDLITDHERRANPREQQQLATLQALLVDPHLAVRPHPRILDPIVSTLHKALAKGNLDSLGSGFARAFLADVELTEGLREGRLIDLSTLDDLLRAGDEPTLRQYARRLPDPTLRAEARRRVIRLHVAASPFRAVRENAAAVEETLMTRGANPVSLTEHRVLRGWIDEPLRTARIVLVRQDVEGQTSTLVGSYADDSAISVLPQLTLRDALHLELEGIDRPVTLCAAPEEFDSAPCAPVNAITLNNPLAYLEPNGAIRFAERISAAETYRLATREERFVVPVMVNGQQLAALDWALRFETPNEFVLSGGGAGGDGPDLRIRMELLAAGRLSYTVSRDSREYVAVIEYNRWRDFDVLSVGAVGSSGTDGTWGLDGTSGSPGTSAMCPSTRGGDGGRGSDGGAGQDGGSAGNGGNGGNIWVEIHAKGAQADSLVALTRWTVASRGGHGGSGGRGGRGGRGGSGGSGGSGTTCVDSDGKVTSLSGGSSGPSGSDGRDGSAGMSGSDGRDGRISVRVVE